MTSEQLRAFDVSQEPAAVRRRVRRHAVRPRLPGRPPADRGRRALRRGHARRLGHPRQQPRDPPQAGARMLDPAFAALLRDLTRREPARAHRRPVLRRVRPHAEGQPARRPRPLAGRLQPGPRRRRHPRRPGHRRRPIPRGSRTPSGPTTIEDVHATVLTAAGPRPGQGEHGPGDRPADQAQPGQADPRAAGLRTGHRRRAGRPGNRLANSHE